MTGPVRSMRYGDFVSKAAVNYRVVSYNRLTPKPLKDAAGADIPYAAPKVRLRARDVIRLLTPYTRTRFMDQVRAVIPLAAYLAFFQAFIFQQPVREPWTVGAGFAIVIVGLMMFMEGVKVGLMPFGEVIGDRLPARFSLPVVLLVAFIIGVGVTFAEPAIGALRTAGGSVDPARSPYLSYILNHRALELALAVGGGVGLACVTGSLRFIYGWSLKPLIYLSLAAALWLTWKLMGDAHMSDLIGLAWDCGAITTGPVTVPLALALGIGIAAASGRSDSPSAGLGIVTLASLFPVVCVMAFGLWVASTTPVSALPAPSAAAAFAPWFARAPFAEILSAIQAVGPVALFLVFLLRVALRERLKEGGVIAYGIALCFAGMALFNVGLAYGLANLGGQAGGMAPAMFTRVDAVAESPVYPWLLGVGIVVVFAAALGFGATVAEPALGALGMTVENLTNGAYRKQFLIYAVAAGVGLGVAAGVVKIIFALPLGALLVALYLLAAVMTFFSTEEFVNIAWDSAGVTTGPVTVPLVLAIGLAFGAATGSDGFGILALCSIFPILTTLSTGLWIQWTVRNSHL